MGGTLAGSAVTGQGGIVFKPRGDLHQLLGRNSSPWGGWAKQRNRLPREATDIQGQVGYSPKQADRVGGVPAPSREVGARWSLRSPSNPSPSTIPCEFGWKHIHDIRAHHPLRKRESSTAWLLWGGQKANTYFTPERNHTWLFVYTKKRSKRC